MKLIINGYGKKWSIIDIESGMRYDGKEWTGDKHKAKIYTKASEAAAVADNLDSLKK